MNEKIKALAEQAGIKFIQVNHKYISNTVILEKFAELIVRECLNTLHNNGYDDAAVELQKHFKG